VSPLIAFKSKLKFAAMEFSRDQKLVMTGQTMILGVKSIAWVLWMDISVKLKIKNQFVPSGNQL